MKQEDCLAVAETSYEKLQQSIAEACEDSLDDILRLTHQRQACITHEICSSDAGETEDTIGNKSNKKSLTVSQDSISTVSYRDIKQGSKYHRTWNELKTSVFLGWTSKVASQEDFCDCF